MIITSGYYTLWITGQNSTWRTPYHQEVANALQKWVFPISGLPSILHSDNGKEFVNQLITEIVESWQGTAQLVSGRPRHHQLQGLVEQVHYILKRMLSAKITEGDSKSPPWTLVATHNFHKFSATRCKARLWPLSTPLNGEYALQGA